MSIELNSSVRSIRCVAMSVGDEKVRAFPAQKKSAEPVPAAVEAPAAATLEAPQPAKGRSRRKIIVPIVALLAAAGAGWFGYNYYTLGRYLVTTDDAYIVGDITTVAPK